MQDNGYYEGGDFAWV
jgi:hypothetical protein